eukprot:CAMPEP_0204302066 /NCGR_PEP_ID=MMETSP0468-20130131/81509_1 /ASSEMBLY_ACC=CAM_ASM_000383 /TAXON_ID=2969 /ORGANISM="Oxyrrhis marina" /LENGTH=241 /DNA_ID=CAMNT_0051281261 /DNA_START=79 /DNA_END=805 /DNA_ORIENTATION=+
MTHFQADEGGNVAKLDTKKRHRQSLPELATETGKKEKLATESAEAQQGRSSIKLGDEVGKIQSTGNSITNALPAPGYVRCSAERTGRASETLLAIAVATQQARHAGRHSRTAWERLSKQAQQQQVYLKVLKLLGSKAKTVIDRLQKRHLKLPKGHLRDTSKPRDPFALLGHLPTIIVPIFHRQDGGSKHHKKYRRSCQRGYPMLPSQRGRLQPRHVYQRQRQAICWSVRRPQIPKVATKAP